MLCLAALQCCAAGEEDWLFSVFLWLKIFTHFFWQKGLWVGMGLCSWTKSQCNEIHESMGNPRPLLRVWAALPPPKSGRRSWRVSRRKLSLARSLGPTNMLEITKQEARRWWQNRSPNLPLETMLHILWHQFPEMMASFSSLRVTNCHEIPILNCPIASWQAPAKSLSLAAPLRVGEAMQETLLSPLEKETADMVAGKTQENLERWGRISWSFGWFWWWMWWCVVTSHSVKVNFWGVSLCPSFSTWVLYEDSKQKMMLQIAGKPQICAAKIVQFQTRAVRCNS